VNNSANTTSFKIGHKHSDAVLAKISQSKMGSIPWNKGIKTGLSSWNKCEPTIINCKQCNAVMELAPWQIKKGKKFCSKDCAYKGRELKATFEKGDKHPLWTNGKFAENQRYRSRKESKQWRKAVFANDNYSCKLCGTKEEPLEADHIKPWCAYPDLRFDVSNGRVLCKPCHIKQDTYGIKARKYKENNLGR
jgi:HNH endonuclease/NUMOD3 motif